MAKTWPRVRGGKCIEKWEIPTDAGTILCRTHMVRGEDSTRWECTALLPDGEFTRLVSKPQHDETLDQLEERFRHHVRERVSIKWEPHLYIEVSSSHLIEPESKRAAFRDFGYRTVDLQLAIKVARVELGTTSSGEKRHRGSIHGGSNKNPQPGWPKVGRQHGRGGFSNGVRMFSLVPDTDPNREAVEAIRRGMQKLNAQLQMALSPEHVEQAFASAHRLLPAGGDS